MRAAQDIAIAGHVQQRIDVAVGQQQGHDAGDDRVGFRRAAQAGVEPQRGGDQQRGEDGLHNPGVERRGRRRQIDQPRAGVALLVDGLFKQARAAAFTVERTQYRLGLGELDHALAGMGEVAMEGVVGAPAQASGDQ